jgi:hypothetical protein
MPYARVDLTEAHERLHRELDTLFLFSAGIADGDTDENAAAVRRAWEVRLTDS